MLIYRRRGSAVSATNHVCIAFPILPTATSHPPQCQKGFCGIPLVCAGCTGIGGWNARKRARPRIQYAEDRLAVLRVHACRAPRAVIAARRHLRCGASTHPPSTASAATIPTHPPGRQAQAAFSLPIKHPAFSFRRNPPASPAALHSLHVCSCCPVVHARAGCASPPDADPRGRFSAPTQRREPSRTNVPADPAKTPATANAVASCRGTYATAASLPMFLQTAAGWGG